MKKKSDFIMAVMKNITFLTGYYGSGKTELAVNLGIKNHVDMVVDLDIINPYFRSREMEAELTTHNIQTISSDLDHKVHLDMPYISRKVFMPFIKKGSTAIYDLGGNDLGAKLLRQFDDYHNQEVDLFLVLNIYRQETDSVDKVLKLINKIEGTGGFKVTGLINNTNLLRDTTMEELLIGEEFVSSVSKASNLPIIYTVVWEKLELDESFKYSGELLRLKLYFRKSWLK